MAVTPASFAAATIRSASRTAPAPPFPESTSIDSPEGVTNRTALPPSTSTTYMSSVFRVCATAIVADRNRTIGSKTLFLMTSPFVGPSPSGRGRRDSQRAGAPGEGRKSSRILRPSAFLKASPYRARASHPLPEGEGDFAYSHPRLPLPHGRYLDRQRSGTNFPINNV